MRDSVAQLPVMTSIWSKQKVPPKRILVAEDDPSVSESLRRVLVLEGHFVEIAKDGGQALSIFVSGKYDLVITDFNMPKMNGLELAEAIKKRSSSTPIILLTGYVEAIRADAKISHVNVILGKPWSIRELQAKLQAVFESPSDDAL